MKNIAMWWGGFKLRLCEWFGLDLSDSPPDLDEVWRELKRKFFGGGDLPPRVNKESSTVKILLSVIAVMMIIWGSSGFFMVLEGQVAVISRFGKYVSTEGAGFHWRLPFPFERHEVVNIAQVRKVEVGFRGESKNKQPQEALMLTDDENIVDLQFVVQYRLKEDGAKDFLFNNRPFDGSSDGGSDILVRQNAESAVREVVGRRSMDFVLYEGREQIARDTAKLIQQILDKYRSGILVTSVAIQNAQPPEQVQAAFDDALKAGQDLERQINEGQAYANEVVPRASGAAARLIQEAEAYKTRVVEVAQGDADRFQSVLAEYMKAPKVTRERMYIETMQTIFSNTSKVLSDSKQSSQLLFLPFDKLMANVDRSSAAASGNLENSGGQTGKSNLSGAGDSVIPLTGAPARDSFARGRERVR
jgi:membrane protease subunit HflK